MSLRLQHISRQFEGVPALSDVSMTATAGSVHALLGENGAGKSTLMHIAYGMIAPDHGTIATEHVSVARFASPRDARAAGIGMVHQHFTSIPAYTVADNIALAAGWSESGRRAERRAAKLMRDLALELPVDITADRLSVQQRQRLEIVKALAADATVLLLDEPTAVLAPREVDELIDFVRRFAADGGTVVLITHKLDEVFRAADQVTVLRRGRVTLDGELAHHTRASLATAMIGGDIPVERDSAAPRGMLRVQTDTLTFRDGDHTTIVGSIALYGGEIIGVAGIEGNGQRGLLRGLAAVDGVAIVSGECVVHGTVEFVPEDRIVEASIPTFSLTENLYLGEVRGSGWWSNWTALRSKTAALMAQHDVRATGPDARIASLSGGNQQKFILARALNQQPAVLIAEDPTRGLDLLATSAVHQRLRDAAAHGCAVIVYSSDLDEVVSLANRILVVTDGVVREMPGGSRREQVGDAMLAVTSR